MVQGINNQSPSLPSMAGPRFVYAVPPLIHFYTRHLATLPFWPLPLAPTRLAFTQRRCAAPLPPPHVACKTASRAQLISPRMPPTHRCPQGRPLDPNNESIIKNPVSQECAKLAWHPLLPLLAIGWKDGKSACPCQPCCPAPSHPSGPLKRLLVFHHSYRRQHIVLECGGAALGVGR